MTPCNKKKFYLNNGRLDLSSLSENIDKNRIQEAEPQLEKVKPQIEDRELAELQSNNIAVTLEEMALMFEEEPKVDKEDLEEECTKAFSPERLREEMKEFGIDK